MKSNNKHNKIKPWLEHKWFLSSRIILLEEKCDHSTAYHYNQHNNDDITIRAPAHINVQHANEIIFI